MVFCRQNGSRLMAPKKDPTKFALSSTGHRVYGTFEWKLPVTADAAQQDWVQSPVFERCGHTWHLFLDPNSEGTGNIAVGLRCNGPLPRPHNEFGFQLWIRHKNPAESVAFGKLNFVHSASALTPEGNEQIAEDATHLFDPFFDNKQFSDIVTRAQDEEVAAHKVVLAAQSAPLGAMLQVLRLLVEHMYGKLEIIQAQALLPLFLAADKYQVAALRRRCLRQILATMDESTVLEYLQAADLVSDSVLMNECLRLWGQPDFSAKVIETSEMVALMQEKPTLVQKLMLTSVNSTQKHKHDQKRKQDQIT